jgi:carboxypeptidase Taq
MVGEIMDFSIKKSRDFIYKQQKELSVLGGIGALLGWDQMTYMPPKGAIDRSEHNALLSLLSHQRVVSDEFWGHITRLYEPSTYETLSNEDKAVVKRLYEDVEKSRKIPSDFVEKMAKTTTLAYQSWEDARKKKDFNVFAPRLTEIIELEKEYCDYINKPGPLYDTLLDDYEEGMTTAKLSNEFSYLKKELSKLLDRITSTHVYEQQKEPTFAVDEAIQKDMCQKVLETMKLPSDSFRMDTSTHPFTIAMGYDDVRITTNYQKKNPLFSLFSTVHEAGHALYELGMPQGVYKDTVISDSPSLGLHESQSRFWENMIGRSKSFWEYFFPLSKGITVNNFKSIDLEEWYKVVNQVRPSLIRVEADELTYCLHVILRFEIESGLMEDRINVSELPEIWREKMERLLGITPSNDVEGVLQDMHWSGGSIGYFPTYAIGSIYASQLFQAITREHPQIDLEIQKGNMGTIIQWLRTNIHQYGRVMTADEIIEKACGSKLNGRCFVSYLQQKYSDIYGF